MTEKETRRRCSGRKKNGDQCARAINVGRTCWQHSRWKKIGIALGFVAAVFVSIMTVVGWYSSAVGAFVDTRSLVPDRALRISPGAPWRIRRGVTNNTLTVHIANPLATDQRSLAILLQITPALAQSNQIEIEPLTPGNSLSVGNVTLDDREIVSRWNEAESTYAIAVIEIIYGNESIDYKVSIETAELASDAELRCKQVDPQLYEKKLATVELAGESTLAVLANMKSGFASSEKAGTMMLTLRAGDWLTPDGKYYELLPELRSRGRHVHLYRDTDNSVKMSIAMARRPTSLLKYDNLGSLKHPSGYCVFGMAWTETAAILTLSNLDQVTVGDYPKGSTSDPPMPPPTYDWNPAGLPSLWTKDAGAKP